LEESAGYSYLAEDVRTDPKDFEEEEEFVDVEV
jgi:hypothetical protein